MENVYVCVCVRVCVCIHVFNIYNIIYIHTSGNLHGFAALTSRWHTPRKKTHQCFSRSVKRAVASEPSSPISWAFSHSRKKKKPTGRPFWCLAGTWRAPIGQKSCTCKIAENQKRATQNNEENMITSRKAGKVLNTEKTKWPVVPCLFFDPSCLGIPGIRWNQGVIWSWKAIPLRLCFNVKKCCYLQRRRCGAQIP